MISDWNSLSVASYYYTVSQKSFQKSAKTLEIG